MEIKKCKCGSVIEPPRQYTICYTCAKEYFKNYRLENIEKIKQQRKETYQLKKEILNAKTNTNRNR